MMDRGQELLSSNEMAHHFKEWTTANVVLKEISFPYKHLILIIDALKSSRSQKQQHPEGKLKLN